MSIHVYLLIYYGRKWGPSSTIRAGDSGAAAEPVADAERARGSTARITMADLAI